MFALILACGSKESEPKDQLAPAAKPEQPAPPAAKPRHVVMAEKVVAAVASGDYAQLDALQNDLTRKELGDINRELYEELRETLADNGVDLAKATMVRVEPTEGMGTVGVEVFLTHEGRELMMHFNVITIGGGYDFVGVARWIKWTDPPTEPEAL